MIRIQCAVKKTAYLDVDLLAELARRRQDDADGAVGGLERRLVHDVHDHRPQEGGRLARARLGDADDVAARQRRRNRLRLSVEPFRATANDTRTKREQ